MKIEISKEGTVLVATIKRPIGTQGFSFFQTAEGDVFVSEKILNRCGFVASALTHTGRSAKIIIETQQDGKLRVSKVLEIDGMLCGKPILFEMAKATQPSASAEQSPKKRSPKTLEVGQTAQGVVASMKEGGYGFIKVPGYRDEMFFHLADLTCDPVDPIDVGTEVEFTVIKGDRGMKAIVERVRTYPIEVAAVEPVDEDKLAGLKLHMETSTPCAKQPQVA